MATPTVGQPAPDLTRPGLTLADGTAALADFTLSQERGHPVVLAFHPGDNTPVCAKQMCSYAAGIEVFRGLAVPVWGISPQGLDSREGFARSHSLGFPLLADTERRVVR
ncbi:redoxin domain-containing protein [Frankia sp. Cpl3]|nr:redoxin domain-containing protein [Parafrankia colletiae]MCK9899174.1 redoxin domain-containing protein [Frankia sp. Cpl3]